MPHVPLSRPSRTILSDLTLLWGLEDEPLRADLTGQEIDDVRLHDSVPVVDAACSALASLQDDLVGPGIQVGHGLDEPHFGGFVARVAGILPAHLGEDSEAPPLGFAYQAGLLTGQIECSV